MTRAFIFVEHTDGAPRRASLECVGAAVAAGATVTALLTGPGAETAAKGVTGAADAVVLTGDGYSPDATAAAIADLVRAAGAAAFLAAATYRGKDLAPRVAALLDVTPFADCIGLSAAGGKLQVVRPWLAGKCIATLQSGGSALVATTRLNVFKPAASGAPTNVTSAAIQAAPKARVTGIEAKASPRLDVKEAPVVVAGGRGLQDADKFKVVEELAAAFGNAAVGARTASRSAKRARQCRRSSTSQSASRARSSTSRACARRARSSRSTRTKTRRSSRSPTTASSATRSRSCPP